MLMFLLAALMVVSLGTANAAERCCPDNDTQEQAKAEPFNSKIGVHFIGTYSPGNQKMVRARMPVLKLLPWDMGPMIEAARDYKRYNPDGIVVIRIFAPVRYTLEDDPVATAQKYWDNHIWSQLKNLSEKDRKLIDYVEMTNEMGECPTWEDLESVEWFTKFSIKFTEVCVAAGFKPVLANIPVGNPSGTLEEMQAKILAYAPALRAAKKVGGVWSYHSYTILYTTDLETEMPYSLRYRRYYEAFTGEYADLADMPMILTEGGVDKHGNADEDGWLARGTAEQYKEWLKWYDSELKKDDYIIGVTLFQNGDVHGWQSFSLEPIADWFVEYWGKATPPSQ